MCHSCSFINMLTQFRFARMIFVETDRNYGKMVAIIIKVFFQVLFYVSFYVRAFNVEKKTILRSSKFKHNLDSSIHQYNTAINNILMQSIWACAKKIRLYIFKHLKKEFSVQVLIRNSTVSHSPNKVYALNIQ